MPKDTTLYMVFMLLSHFIPFYMVMGIIGLLLAPYRGKV